MLKFYRKRLKQQMKTGEPVKWTRGFTLIEVFVVLAVLGAILLIVMPSLLSMLHRYKVKTTAHSIATQMRFARNVCVASKLPYRVVITQDGETGPPSPNTYAIQYNSEGTWLKVAGMDFNLPEGIRIQDVSPNGPILFSSNGGVSNKYKIDVEFPDVLQYRVTIRRTGDVEVECEKYCN